MINKTKVKLVRIKDDLSLSTRRQHQHQPIMVLAAGNLQQFSGLGGRGLRQVEEGQGGRQVEAGEGGLGQMRRGGTGGAGDRWGSHIIEVTKKFP